MKSDNIYKVCTIHGNQPHRAETQNKEGYIRYRCILCRSKVSKEYKRRLKAKLVEAFGGCCKICGYDRYIGALEFHHLNPDLKEFKISSTQSFAKAYEEAQKCILMCSNCHKEAEAKIIMVDIV